LKPFDRNLFFKLQIKKRVKLIPAKPFPQVEQKEYSK